MKRLLFVALLLILNFTLMAQGFPLTQNLASDSTLVRVGTNSKGAIRGSLIPSTYTDTTQANAGRIDDYPFAVIATSGDGNTWVRNYLGTGWVLLTGGNFPTGQFYNLTGNYLPITPANLGVGFNDPFNQLNFKTNNTVQLTIPTSGIVRSAAAVNKYLMMDTITKEMYYGDAGTGATPTWQQTLTAGSTLTGNNTIAGGGFDFTWNNMGDIAFNLAGGKTFNLTGIAAGASTDSVMVWNASNGKVGYRNASGLGGSGGGIGGYTDSVANVLNYGAAADGVTDDSTAFLAAVATGKPVYVPKGVYKMTATLYVNDKQTIFGVGSESVIYTTADKTVLKLSDSSTVRDLSFRGSGALGAFPTWTDTLTQNGIWINGYDNRVTGCRFFKMKGRGVMILDMAYTQMEGNIIMNNIADSCTVGFEASFGSNYNSFIGNMARYGFCGYFEGGAANMMNDANTYAYNQYGMYWKANGQRGSVVNCNLNHNNVAGMEFATSASGNYGMLISACTFYFSNLNVGTVDTVKYLTFDNCRFANMTITGTYADSNYIVYGRFINPVTTSGSGITYRDVVNASGKPYSLVNGSLSAGSGISITGSGTVASPYSIAATGGGITIGTTTITSGTDKRVLFDDNGTVGEDAGLSYNKTTDYLTVSNLSPSGGIIQQYTSGSAGAYKIYDATQGSQMNLQADGTAYSSINTTATNLLMGNANSAPVVIGNYAGSVPSAKFVVYTTSYGSIPAPVMTGAQRDAISSPATGLQVFSSNSNKISYYNGSGWRIVADSADVTAVTESTYTPTLYNTTNIAASTAYVTHYQRVGGVVYVWGEVDIDATSATTLSELGMDIPTGGAFDNSRDLAGTAAFEDNTSVLIKGDTSNARAIFRFTPQTDTNNKYSFHFSYKYIAP